MSSRRAPGAFTLIEVTIALAIALALAALTLPPLGRWLRDGQFREACRRVESGLEVCRAESVRRGAAVAAVCRTRGDGIWVIESSPLEERPEAEVGPQESGGSTGSPVPGGQPRARGGSDVENADGTGRPSPLLRRAVVVLDSGMSFLVGSAAAPSDSDRAPSVPAVEVVLAVFLPDGSASGETGATLRDRHGTMAQLRVNSWTGTATMIAVSRASDTAVTGRAEREAAPEGGKR